jgi:biotin transport system ATP-binding protein
MDIIEIQRLTYRYDDTRRGVEDIHFSIQRGEFVVIVGPNGSGKTTLLRHLNGLLTPDSGSVHIDGMDVMENIADARQMVGMVFQDADSQIVGETVWEDVSFGPENLGLDRKEIDCRVSRALDAVGLGGASEQRTYTLSGGEKRRLVIAGVLAMDPKILVFDEPFSDLDYTGVKQVLEQIVALHRAGYTVILTTHDLEKVIDHAGRLMIMQDGRIVRDGSPPALVKDLERFGVREPCLSRIGAGMGTWLN